MTITQNEIDLTLILQELGKSKTYPEKITAALDRLLAQMPKPAEAPNPVDILAAKKAEQERLERNKGPRNTVNRGMVMAPPSAEEIEQQQEYKRQEQERKQRAAQPSVPRKAVA
jgi:hypothetical protein